MTETFSSRAQPDSPAPSLIPRGWGDVPAFTITSERTTLGSDPANDVCVPNPTVAPRHAVIVRRFGQYLVSDLGSRTGTFLNGNAIRPRTRILDRDELRIGSARFFCTGFPKTERESFLRMDSNSILTVLAAMVLMMLIYFQAPRAIKYLLNEQSMPSYTGVAAWLPFLNRYRGRAGLPPVVEVPVLSQADRAHAGYLVTAYGDQILRGANLGVELHTEDAAKIGYSKDGLEAARRSLVAVYPGSSNSDSLSSTWPIENWMATPLGRLAILNLRLRGVGWGNACAHSACAAALDVTSDVLALPPEGETFARPIVYPPRNGQITGLRMGFGGLGVLRSCPDGTAPRGYPITLQTGQWQTPRLQSYQLKREDAAGNVTRVAVCGFDAGSYTSRDAAVQLLGRLLLKVFGAVVIIPRRPLAVPARYDVVLVVDGRTHRWSFTTSFADSGN